MKYLPFLTGVYTTAPGLVAASKHETDADKLIFQIDAFYDGYVKNKALCREENISKYYCEHNASIETTRLTNEEKKALWSSVRSMSPESLAYKGLTGVTDFLLRHLFEQ